MYINLFAGELEITKIPKLNAKSLFCSLPPSTIDRICSACIEVHQSVYNKFTFNLLKDISAGKCEQKLVEISNEVTNTVPVHVRQCPMEPDFFISQGNKPGWVLVLFPTDSPGHFKPAVHLGPFDSLLDNKQLISKYIMKSIKVPLI